MAELPILWRRVDLPGHDACVLHTSDAGHCLTGTAVFGLEGRPCQLSYQVECEADWRSRAARISGWFGSDKVEMTITALPDGRWLFNGSEIAAVAGCVDVDLGFTPATNLFQIRRLALGIGEEADAPAAWINFPNLTLERLEHRYHRISPGEYDYEAPDVGYAAILRVNETGFVTHYPGLWEMEVLK
jgi:uncharacterized protein